MAKAKRANRNATTKKPSKKKSPPKLPHAIFDDDGAAGRTVVAAHGEHVVLCDGTSLRLHTVDAPIRHVRHGARIVAVARTATRSAALDRLGTLHVYDDAGEVVVTRPVGDNPRSLVAASDRFVAVLEHGVAIYDGVRLERIDYPRGVVAAADPGGSIVIVGEDKRLAEWTGKELLEIPPSVEQIVGIASLGDRRFVCVGQKNMFLLDLAGRELESLSLPSESPHVAAATDRIAWTARGSVSVGRIIGGRLASEHLVAYPGTYSAPNGELLGVTGIAFLGDDRIAIALDRGRGNIVDVDAQQALKLDEHPGDPRASWVFVFGGKILVAG